MNTKVQYRDLNEIISNIIDSICQSTQIDELKVVDEEIYGIKRLRSIQQYLPCLCGFYTLYNAFFKANLNLPVFWKFYFQIVRELNKTFDGDFSDFQELQRYHLDFVLENKIIETLPIYQSQQKLENEIITIMYGCDIIQNSLEDLIDIQKKFVQIKSKKIQNLTIICGITIHYLVIDLIWENEKLQMYLIDSLNKSMIKLFNTQQIIDNFLPVDERRKLVYKKDLRNILMIVQRLLNGQEIVDIYLENAINALKESFEEYEGQLKKWLKDEYPVPVIRHMIFNVAKHFNRKLGQMNWIMERNEEELQELQNELIKLI